MITCRETVERISRDDGNGVWGWFSLRLHLLMCRHCSAFERHLRALGKGIRRLSAGDEESIRKLEQEVLERLGGENGPSSGTR